MTTYRAARGVCVAAAAAALGWCGMAGVAAQTANASTGTTPTPSASEQATGTTGAATPTPSTTATATATATAGSCPPAPPGKDKTDHGFLEPGPVVSTAAGVPVVQQPVALRLICFDVGSQHAEVGFTGTSATGATVDVPVLSGPTSFEFVGHQDASVVDASESYTLDLTPLGAAGATGWHLQVNVSIVEDRSASRSAPFIIVPAATPPPVTATPSPPVVAPTAASRAPHAAHTTHVRAVRLTRSLPFTGMTHTGSLLLAGTTLVVVGAISLLRGRRRAGRSGD